MTTGLVIARYQPAHVTHLEVFEFAKQQGIDELVVVKGSADKYRIPRHPFTPTECVDMLDMYLKRANINYHIFALEDVSQNIKSDSEELTEQDLNNYESYAKMLISKLPKFEVALLGNPTIKIPLERLGYNVIPPRSELHCSATYIRREYTLHGDRCEDLLIPEQVAYMDRFGLYDIMKDIGLQEFHGEEVNN